MRLIFLHADASDTFRHFVLSQAKAVFLSEHNVELKWDL